jgi:quercetin dioxygenase-like cupin family protein
MSGYVLAPEGGETYIWHDARVMLKATSAQTMGQLSFMESVYPPDLAVPPHVHEGEDEMFYVLEGELKGFCEDDQWVATPGSFVFVPRDKQHGFTVVSKHAARAVVVTGPPRLDGQVAASGMLFTNDRHASDGKPS